MSTRWYPLYQRGNPQLRVFLPNFWLKLVRSEESLPPNVVQFIVSQEMTKMDIHNYLEKIYKVPVLNVQTRIAMGKTKRDQQKGYITKEDDFKVAYVTLPRNHEFNFPDLFPKNETEEMEKQRLNDAEKAFNKFRSVSKNRPGVPPWFSL